MSVSRSVGRSVASMSQKAFCDIETTDLPTYDHERNE